MEVDVVVMQPKLVDVTHCGYKWTNFAKSDVRERISLYSRSSECGVVVWGS